MSNDSAGIVRHNPNARMSPVVEVRTGATVVISGQVADDGIAGLEAQTHDVLRKVDELLAIAGSGRANVFAANIWLTDMRGFAQFNTIWDEWVPAGKAPARVCVEARLPQPAALVEVQVWATK